MSLMDRRRSIEHIVQDVETAPVGVVGIPPQPTSTGQQSPFPTNGMPPTQHSIPPVQQLDFPPAWGAAPYPTEMTPPPSVAPGYTGATPPPVAPMSFVSGTPTIQQPFSQPGGASPAPNSMSGFSLQMSPAEPKEPNVTRQLVSGVARQLAGTTTTTLLTKNTNSLRDPVIIPATGKEKPALPPRPPTRRRMVVHAVVSGLLLLAVLLTLIVVIPTATGKGSNIFDSIMNLSNSKANNSSIVTSQAATATAVTQDGYDQGNVSYAGLPSAPSSNAGSGLARFFYGQCTYWANMRYHQLTGLWVPWIGNANQWVSGAYNSGWIVSTQPKVGSIIVLQAGREGAGWYGHVAIVEGINSDGSVNTSNWNWAGNWGARTMVTFQPGPGVDFVWAPGH